MRAVLLLLTAAGLLSSCQKEAQKTLAMAEPTEMTAKQGHGKVVLQCGAQQLSIDGICGGTTSSGDLIVAVQDKTVAAKVFTITFNTKAYPDNGKTYTIKKSDFMSEGKKPANEVYVGFSEITPKNQMDWSSDDVSGTLQFERNGNEIKCAFKNIKLQPSIVYNKSGLNKPGTVSGEMTFYKN